MNHRRAWRVGDHFEVVSRSAKERYRVDVEGGMPLCICTAAKYSRPCYHAAVVLRRVMREAPRPPEPSVDELFAMVAGGAS